MDKLVCSKYYFPKLRTFCYTQLSDMQPFCHCQNPLDLTVHLYLQKTVALLPVLSSFLEKWDQSVTLKLTLPSGLRRKGLGSKEQHED